MAYLLPEKMVLEGDGIVRQCDEADDMQLQKLREDYFEARKRLPKALISRELEEDLLIRYKKVYDETMDTQAQKAGRVKPIPQDLDSFYHEIHTVPSKEYDGN